MAHVRSLVEKVARSMAPVLVQGESGTGKELVARAIHDVSARAGQPFVAVNCGAIPENLLESEFFGVRKGAFTGANADRDGFFQAANGGTLFLDEIGDLPFAMQSKLLRAIQERAVRAVGGTTEQTMNVRIVSATHKDLAAEVQAGRFRQDLFYRLNVIDIKVPPLRERLVDLPAIADALLARLAREAGVSPPPRLAADARALLARYAFPGNVRELENLLHRAVALSDGEAINGVDLALPEALLAGAARARRDAADPDGSDDRGGGRRRRRDPSVADGAGAGAAGAAPPRRSRCPRPGALSRRGRARDPRARARAPELQPHRRRRQPRAVAAADALPDGAARHHRVRVVRPGLRRWPTTTGTAAGGAAPRACRRPTSAPRPAGARVDLVVLHSISLPPGEYGGDAIERLFTNTLDLSAPPSSRRSAGWRSPPISSCGATARCCSSSRSTSARGMPAARAGTAATTATTGRSASSSKASRATTFEPAQYAALATLLPRDRRRAAIRHVVGHEHVAPGRKLDPGPGFDWRELAARLRWDARAHSARRAAAGLTSAPTGVRFPCGLASAGYGARRASMRVGAEPVPQRRGLTASDASARTKIRSPVIKVSSSVRL